MIAFIVPEKKIPKNYTFIGLLNQAPPPLPLTSQEDTNLDKKISNVKHALHIHFKPKIRIDQNFSIARYIKNLKEINLFKMSTAFIVYNNNAQKLLTN